MKRFITLFIFILILSGVVFSNPVNYSSQPRYHIVSPGNCLWNLANRYLGNPYLWPHIWESNRNIIKNPHWIYPGQRLVIPPIAATYVPSELHDAPAGVEITILEVPEPAVAYDMALRCGYITNEHVNNPTYIISTVDPDIDGIFNGVEVFIDAGTNRNLEEEQLLLIFNINTNVNHPITGRNLGHIIDISGILKVLEVQQNTARCLISNSFKDSIEIGNYVVPYRSPDIPYDVTFETSDRLLEGTIVAINTQGLTKSQAFVYLDIGENQNLDVGDIFEILKPENRVSHPATGRGVDLPELIVGHIQVLNVQTNTSTGYIMDITNRIDLNVGDKVRLIGISNPQPIQTSLEF